MLRDEAEVRRAFQQAGWSVSWLLENALVVEGTVYDVTNVLADRDQLRARVQVVRDCAVGGVADRCTEMLAPRPLSAVQWAEKTKVTVEVHDFGGAAAELERLCAALERSTRDCAGALEARGWRVVRETSPESAAWDQSWELVAERPGESLRVGLVSSTMAVGERMITESATWRGTATCSVRGSRATLRIGSAAEADELAKALTRRHP